MTMGDRHLRKASLRSVLSLLSFGKCGCFYYRPIFRNETSRKGLSGSASFDFAYRWIKSDATVLHIVSSAVILDRRSKFIGHACHVDSPSEVYEALKVIRESKIARKASHPAMHAWRVEMDRKIVEGSSNDGEANAGQLLLSLLRTRNESGRLVAVTRFYGGKQLGGDRFRHIRAAAGEALGLLGGK